METNFFARVETSYSNTPPQVHARDLKMRIMDLAPGATPDLRDIRDFGVASVIRLISPFVYLTVLGKEWIQTVIATTRWRFGKINVAETIDSQA